MRNLQVRQWIASRRGSQNVKGGPAAAETTLLQSAVKHHRWVQDCAASQTLPPKAVSSGIIKMAGTKSTNQHTARDAVRS